MVWISLLSLLVTGLAFQGAPAQSVSTTVADTRSHHHTGAARRHHDGSQDVPVSAIDYYKPGADASPTLANKTGIAYQQLLEFASARKYYEKAIKANPKYAEAVNNLGTVFYALEIVPPRGGAVSEGAAAEPNSASFPQQSGNGVLRPQKLQGSATDIPEAGLAESTPMSHKHHNTVGTTLQDRTVEETAKLHYFVAKTYAKARVRRSRRCSTFARRSKKASRRREKFLKEPEFAGLQEDPEFKVLMATEQKVL